MKPIKTGDPIPEFCLEDQHGKMLNINEFLGKAILLISICPQGEKIGCDSKACNFCDNGSSFGKSGTVMIGITSQPPESTHAFADRHIMNYPILSDPDGKIRKLFGITSSQGGHESERITYIVNREGIVTSIFTSQHLHECRADEALKIDLLIKKTDDLKS
ncbi:MAG: redoxin domain-containing protein [Bacteroidales bacterium]